MFNKFDKMFGCFWVLWSLTRCFEVGSLRETFSGFCLKQMPQQPWNDVTGNQDGKDEANKENQPENLEVLPRWPGNYSWNWEKFDHPLWDICKYLRINGSSLSENLKLRMVSGVEHGSRMFVNVEELRTTVTHRFLVACWSTNILSPRWGGVHAVNTNFQDHPSGSDMKPHIGQETTDF